MPRRFSISIATAATLLLGGAMLSGADAQAPAATGYPAKPVRVLVAFAPAGPTDIMARVIGQKLTEQWGQTVVVENRPGAGGNVATQAVARAAADGYTVLCITTAFAVNPSLSRDAGYVAERDFVTAIVPASGPNIMVVNPKVPAQTLQEFIALARSGKLNYASAGVGTTPHLGAEYLLRVIAKVDITHIPYNGGAPAVAAAAGGHVEMTSVAVSAAVAMVKDGQVRALAVTGLKRLPALPDVPTVAESGFPGYEAATWVGFFLPAGTPPAIVEQWNAGVNQALRLPDVVERLTAVGLEVVGGSQKESAQYVADEIVKWGRVVREVGVKVE